MSQTEGSRSAHPAPRGRGPEDWRVLLASACGAREAKCPTVCVCARGRGAAPTASALLLGNQTQERTVPPQTPSAERHGLSMGLFSQSEGGGVAAQPLQSPWVQGPQNTFKQCALKLHHDPQVQPTEGGYHLQTQRASGSFQGSLSPRRHP